MQAVNKATTFGAMADASPDEVLEEVLCWSKIVVREEPKVAGKAVLIGPEQQLLTAFD